MKFYPLKMTPEFKQYIWGGENLRKIYQKNAPEPPVAESWEISAHPDGTSHIANGEYEGKTIEELSSLFGEEFFGKSIKKGEPFPLLLKILDACDRLSVQVHPDDAYASENENGSKGKTEAWYILSAEEGASLIYGFKDGITKEIFRKAIEEGRCEECLNSVPCKAGDVFYIPSGTVHAVGKGLIIAEIQQSSNTTYRVYDYQRRGKDGKLRELHIEKSLDVADFSSSLGNEKTVGTVEKNGNNELWHIIDNEFFVFEKICLNESFETKTDFRLHMLFFADGNAEISGESFKAGDSVVIPAGMNDYCISGRGTVLRFYVR